MSQSKFNNLGKVLYMNVVLTFHLSQCLALASLLPQISEQNHYSVLGQLGLICIYSVNLLMNLIAPMYLTKWKYRNGFLFQALLVIPCFIPAFFVARCNGEQIESTICQPYILVPFTLLGCVFLGAGLGGYFVLQNTYVSECTNEKNKELYFGITYMLLGCAYLLNGLTSDQLLQYIGRREFFLYSGSIELVLSLLFAFVQQPYKHAKNIVLDLSENLTVSESVNVNEEFALLPIKEQVFRMKEKFKQQEMKMLFPLFISTGIVIGFEFGIFHKFITASFPNSDETTINVKTAKVFLFLGIAQIVSGIINGISRSFIGIIQNSILYSNIWQCMIIVAVINAFTQEYYLNIILGFLIGLTDNTGQFNSAVLISDIWNEEMAVFGLYLFCQNFGVMLINLIAIFLDGQNLIYYVCVLIFFQSITSFSQQQFKRQQDKKNVKY